MKMKALAIIHFITNYETKGNYCQYKRIISTTIVWKEYKDAQSKTTTNGSLLPVRYADLNKFVLKTFNKLAYK